MLTIQHRYELASRACIQAVAAEGGVNVGFNDFEFDYKHDGTFQRLVKHDHHILPTGMPLPFQAKASKDWRIRGDDIAYDLDATTFNHLVDANTGDGLPKVLVLFCIPNDGAGWVSVSHEAVQLRQACYWLIVRGKKTRSTSTQVVYFPRKNILNAARLNDLLDWVNSHTMTPPPTTDP